MKLTKYFKHFFNNSESSGSILLLCVIVSLLIANSFLGPGFNQLLHMEIGPYSVSSWINDGLMAIFFLSVGLEIKREKIDGELSDMKSALVPVAAALGGMLVPGLIYALFNHNTIYHHGWGIPMATDIAFSLAIITMLGKRVPLSLKVFLAALAIVDDLGAIVVIALFYSSDLNWSYLLYCLLIAGGLIILNKKGIKNLLFYLIPGLFMWYFMHHSGVHATIAGVILAFCIPMDVKDPSNSPLEKLEHAIAKPVAFGIMPLFALANVDITFEDGMVDGLFTSLGAGIILGLVVGKTVGIVIASFLMIKFKLGKMPTDASWAQMIGVGLLAGIGFTMSIFVALLSFKGNHDFQDEAKFAILVASTLAGILGYTYLRMISKKDKNKEIA